MRGMGNMQGMMKKVQQMQKQMMEEQAKLNVQEFIGEASNGLVQVTLAGERKVTKVAIAPEVVDPEDKEMLEDLVLMAVNDALKKVEDETSKTMGKYTQGMPGF